MDRKYKSIIEIKGGLNDDIRSGLILPVKDTEKSTKLLKPFVLWRVHHR